MNATETQHTRSIGDLRGWSLDLILEAAEDAASFHAVAGNDAHAADIRRAVMFARNERPGYAEDDIKLGLTDTDLDEEAAA